MPDTNDIDEILGKSGVPGYVKPDQQQGLTPYSDKTDDIDAILGNSGVPGYTKPNEVSSPLSMGVTPLANNPQPQDPSGIVPLTTTPANTNGDLVRTALLKTATTIMGLPDMVMNAAGTAARDIAVGAKVLSGWDNTQDAVNSTPKPNMLTPFPNTQATDKLLTDVGAEVQPQTQAEAHVLAREEGAMTFAAFGAKDLLESVAGRIADGTATILNDSGLVSKFYAPVKAGVGSISDVAQQAVPGAVAGEVAQNLDESNPNDPIGNFLKTAGATVLTATGLKAGTMTLAAPLKTASYLKNVVTGTITPEGRQELAEYKVGKEMNNAATDSQGSINKLSNTDETGLDAGGVLTGDVANDTGLNKYFEEAAGKYSGVSDTFKGAMSDYEGNLHGQLSSVFQNALDKFQTKYNVDLSDPTAIGKLSEDAKSELGSIKAASNDVVNHLFDEDRVDPAGKAQFDTTPLKDAVDEIRDSKTKYSTDAIPSVTNLISPKATEGEATASEPFNVNSALGMADNTAGEAESNSVGYKELKDLQSNLKGSLADAKAANGGIGNRPLVASYQKLISAVNDTITNHETTDTGVAGRYNEAVQARSAFGKNFEQGKMGDVFSTLGYSEPKQDPSLTLGNFVGQKGLAPMKQLQDVISHAKDMASDEDLSGVVNPDELNNSAETVKKQVALHAYSNFKDANNVIDVNKLINANSNNPRLLDETFGKGFTKSVQPLANELDRVRGELKTGKYDFQNTGVEETNWKKLGVTLASRFYTAALGRVSKHTLLIASAPSWFDAAIHSLTKGEIQNVLNGAGLNPEYAATLMQKASGADKNSTLKMIKALKNDTPLGVYNKPMVKAGAVSSEANNNNQQ